MSEEKKSHKLRTTIIIVGVFLVLYAIGASVQNDKSSTTGVTNTTTTIPKTSTTDNANTSSEDQGKVEVINHQAKTKSYGTPYIVGEVQNNTSNPVSSVNIKATMYDADGNVVDTDETYVAGYGDPELQPGKTEAFEILLTDDPVFDTYKLDVSW